MLKKPIFLINLIEKNMKYFLAFFLLIFFAGLSYSQSNGFVSTKGKEIVTADGNPILLKGINLGNWLVPEGYMFKFGDVSSPRLIHDFFNQLIGPEAANKFWKDFRKNYITKKDIEFIKASGFNSVRVPFNFRLFAYEDNPDIFLEEGFVHLDNVISWCRDEGIYVILDMHCAPGGQTGDNIDDSYGYPFLFESPESQKLTIDIWTKIAERYKDETIVLAYDLLNEPIAHYFDKEKLNPLLEPLFKRMVESIRTVDKNHIIFLGGAQWNSNFSVFGPPFDDKLVYTFHKYWTEPTQDVIQDYIDYADKYNVPIWMGESGENTNEWINSFKNTLEKNNIGWCFWPYKKLDSPRGVVSINLTEEFEKIIAFAKADRSNYEKIRNNRPDPEIVKKALADYLENSKLEKCKINTDYLKALGLK
jgi:endoglucanase